MSVISVRTKRLINTDPQRRCYNGCHFSSEIVWGPWEVLEYDPRDPDKRLKFWRELNDYAISERGESARSEYKLCEEPVGCP